MSGKLLETTHSIYLFTLFNFFFCDNTVFTGLQQHSQSPNSTSVANGSTTNMLDQHNSDLPAKGISLHEHVLRWGEKKSIQDFNSLFSVTGVSVECKFKISPSGYCKKKCKAQQREGLWVILQRISLMIISSLKQLDEQVYLGERCTSWLIFFNFRPKSFIV